MTGPVVEILLRRQMSTREIFDRIAAAGGALGLPVHAPPADEPETIAVLTLPCGREFSIWLVPADQDREPEEMTLLAQHAGYRPAAGLQVVSWTRDRATARLQAELTIALAAAEDALIDLTGALAPPGACRGDDLAASLDEVRRYVAGRPGVLIEVPYPLAVEGSWIFHVVDSTFLCGWLDDPDFHLIT